VTYLTGARYAPALEGGLRHDDPALAVTWPLPPIELSAKDREWPLLSESEPIIRARMVADTARAGGHS